MMCSVGPAKYECVVVDHTELDLRNLQKARNLENNEFWIDAVLTAIVNICVLDNNICICFGEIDACQI